MGEAVTRGALWPTGDYSGKEAEHTVWPSRNESGRPLISALLPMRANSSQLLPSQATAPDRQWATGAAYRFIKPQPKHTEPHPFPPMKTTHSNRGNGQAHALVTSFTLIIFYSHLSSMPFLLVSQLPLSCSCYFIE